MGKIIVIGSSNTDMVVRSPRIPTDGETILGGDFKIVQGGKGANQAVAVARAGGNVWFVAKVGNDSFGLEAKNRYKLDGIHSDYVSVVEKIPTGFAFIGVWEATGQNAIVVSPGANNQLTVNDVLAVEKIMDEPGIMLLQLEIPLPVVKASLELGKSKRFTTVLNPAPACHLTDEILKLVDIITPNETETEILTGILPADKNSIEKAAEILLGKVNQAVVITLGNKGVFYAAKSGECAYIPSIKVSAVDTTAAGDVFNGYLTAALNKGKNLAEACSIANKAASISVTRFGAQPSIPYINELV